MTTEDTGALSSAPAPLTAAVFGELVEELARLEGRLHLAETPLDEATVLEGYQWIFSILAVGLDAHVWADADRPRFVDIVGPYRKWGGDNADAYYQYAPIDPSRTYRVRGRRGDAVYLSLTVYGGPDDGRYSERIVGTVNDRMLDMGDDGSFEIILSPHPQEGAWIKLEPDAVCALTRDYLVDPVEGRRVQWRIEAVDPPAARRQTDADLARRFRAALTSGNRTPSTSPTRCPATPSAGPPATPPTPWVPTNWPTTRFSCSRAGRRPAPSGTSVCGTSSCTPTTTTTSASP
jgi:hypothetical protein